MEQFIIDNPSYQKIALQFPDDLLNESVEWERRLHASTGRDFFILADTSYGSCCVDEVAAQHINADLVIHFGHACMTPTSRLPVYYHFHQLPLDIDQCVQSFRHRVEANNSPLLLISDQEYNYCLDELAERLKFSGMHVAVAKIESEIFIPGTQSIDKSSSKCSSSHFCGRHFIGVDSLNDIDHSYKILYVGRTRVFLDTLMMTFPRASGVYHFDPTITAAAADEGECILASSQMTRLLSKRLLMIEKIRAATRIGILVGTLAVASYVDIIDSVQTLIEASDKRAHVVVVGKLNPAKLGNFMEIEVFVNVACPENSLIDGREFLQPIVTPFELYLALKPSTEGNDEASAVYERYILDFRRLLDDFRDYNVDVEQQKEEEEEQLISGQLARLNVHEGGGGSNLPMVQLNHKQSALSVIDRRTTGSAVQRSWWGLDIREANQKTATIAEEGRSGVARGYLGESVSYD